MTSSDPIKIAALRADALESLHRVHVVVAGPDGDATHVFGDGDRPVFPRSALKAIQALPLVESGAADAFELPPAALALACASHKAEAAHVRTATALLQRLALDQEALACGPQWPRRPDDEAAMIRAGETPGRVHNNCSGKHGGMLATARHLGEDIAGYQAPDHPVQRRILETVESLSGCSLASATIAIDGCSAPNPALPLTALAVAAARFAEASASRLGARRAEACRRLMAAMQAAPAMLSGSDSLDSELVDLFDGRVFAKTGAEGAYMLYLPEHRLGVALKAEDGAKRAAEAAVWSILARLGLLDDRAAAALRHHCRPEIRNWDGLLTGRLTEWRDGAPDDA